MLAIIRCTIFVWPVTVKNIKIMIYTNIILPVVLYWYENWSLILTEEPRL
jgi:hypothetical protein